PQPLQQAAGQGHHLRVGLGVGAADQLHPRLAELPAPASLGFFVAEDVLGVTEARSEEHTSELQSRENLVCRLLLEKKKAQKWKPLSMSFRATSSLVSWCLRRRATPTILVPRSFTTSTLSISKSMI